MTNDDMELVRQYAAHRSESAFAALVSRYTNLVYSASLRRVRDPQLAEEITQAVFIILARKAGSLSGRTILPGWLYCTTGYVSNSALRGEHRRHQREQEAFMQSKLQEPPPDAAWRQMAPLLEEAMLRLGQNDRDALVLRYFEGRSLNEVGAALGASEDAAKKRVTRAVEKLRGYFTKRGIILTASVMAAAISANSVQAAPVGLTVKVSAAATGAAAGGSTLMLVKGALKLMAWTKAKLAILLGAAVVLEIGVSTVVIKAELESTGIPWFDHPMTTDITMNNAFFEKAPRRFVLRPTLYLNDRPMPYEADNHLVGLHVQANMLLAFAYTWSASRIVLPEDASTESFDVLVTTPEHPREKLQQELKARLDLVAHHETREVPVLKLQAGNRQPDGLKRSDASSAVPTVITTHDHELILKHAEFKSLVVYVEASAGVPVFDETTLDNGKYDIHLSWKPQDGETEREALERALQDQLGLEVVPDRAPVELLVVEKLK